MAEPTRPRSRRPRSRASRSQDRRLQAQRVQAPRVQAPRSQAVAGKKEIGIKLGPCSRARLWRLGQQGSRLSSISPSSGMKQIIHSSKGRYHNQRGSESSDDKRPSKPRRKEGMQIASKKGSPPTSAIRRPHQHSAASEAAPFIRIASCPEHTHITFKSAQVIGSRLRSGSVLFPIEGAKPP